MGEIAARLSDLVVVTSDNPRSEDPLAILSEIEAGVREDRLAEVASFGPRDRFRDSGFGSDS